MCVCAYMCPHKPIHIHVHTHLPVGTDPLGREKVQVEKSSRIGHLKELYVQENYNQEQGEKEAIQQTSLEDTFELACFL